MISVDLSDPGLPSQFLHRVLVRFVGGLGDEGVWSQGWIGNSKQILSNRICGQSLRQNLWTEFATEFKTKFKTKFETQFPAELEHGRRSWQIPIRTRRTAIGQTVDERRPRSGCEKTGGQTGKSWKEIQGGPA